MGCGHSALGKLSKSDQLSDNEVAAVYDSFPFANLSGAIVCSRVLLAGIVYSSADYVRAVRTNDYTLAFQTGDQKSKSFGFAKKYISFCRVDCSSCTQFCHHAVIVASHQLHDIQLGCDSITGATARQIHVITPTKYVNHLPYIHVLERACKLEYWCFHVYIVEPLVKDTPEIRTLLY